MQVGMARRHHCRHRCQRRGTLLYPSHTRGKFSCKALAQPKAFSSPPRGGPPLSGAPCWGSWAAVTPSCIIVNSSSIAARQQEASSPLDCNCSVEKKCVGMLSQVPCSVQGVEGCALVIYCTQKSGG